MIRTVIVDDDVLFGEALRHALADRGYHVEQVIPSGKDAVDVVRRIRPDLVLMNVRPADSDGLEVGRAIVHHVPSTKVLAVTGSHDSELVWRTMQAGFRGYVTKRSSMSTLVESLEAVVSGRTVTPRGRPMEAPPVSSWSSEALTSREHEILGLLARGATTKQIAATLHIATNTVRSHVQTLLSKLGAHSRLEAVAIARRRGLLVDLDDASVSSMDPR